MSRYLILLVLNTPFVALGLLNSLVKYKLSQISRRRYIYQTVVWLFIFAGLALAEPIYLFLFSNKLTATETLSLFDVIQITGIVALIFIAHRTREKVESLERRVHELHQELSLRLSSPEPPRRREPRTPKREPASRLQSSR